MAVLPRVAYSDQRAGADLLFSDTPIETSAIAQDKEGAIDSKTELGLSREAPVDLISDSVEYDEVAGIATAVGNVELVQSGRILRAEKISYDVDNDIVIAEGQVVLNEPTGDIYFADRVELKDEMKDGFVTGVRGVLADGSRFTASEAEKIADLKVIMNKAKYTACESCKTDPSKPPIWQLRADKVTHHKDEKRVSYEDATFEVAGVPVLYTPYFSHSDGSVERKSGFLTPSFGFDSELGAFYQQDYYWNIAPEKDATIGAMAMTEEAPLMLGEYRQRFKNAKIQLNGGLTYSSRIDRRGDQGVFVDDEERGHFLAEGVWDINEKWRAGTNLALVSDDQYFRQYNISTEDVLENEIYTERFSGRHYSTGRIIRFKDIRVSDRAEDQPNVLPELYTRFLGQPNSLLGGRWSLEASALGLQREGNEQDVLRGITKLGWERRFINNLGLVTTVNSSLRGDAYRTTDKELANALGRNTRSSALRGFANTHIETSYPLQKGFEKGHMVVEPLGAIMLGTNLNENSDIPNEDSQDVFLDSNNIFNPNRFPGYDRIEDEMHATYGLRTGYYADNGHQGEVFFGQSYRLDDDDNPFPAGSGLSEQESDFVGSVDARFGRALQLGYGFQLANDNLGSRRHEVDMTTNIGRFNFGTKYFYSTALAGTDLDTRREQIRNSARFRLTDEWSAFATTQYDLARETEGLRFLSYGLDYQGQCVSLYFTASRKLINESTGDSGTQIFMRIGLKNLGEFETSNITIGSEEE
jgi:LPS-assembly protein